MDRNKNLQTFLSDNPSCIYTTHKTPIGNLLIASDDIGITHVALIDSFSFNENQSITPLFEETKKQLDEYFSGKRKEFDILLNPKGTDFQKSVWNALQTIPYGMTMSYKEIAKIIGNENACRAVGNANNKNPVMIVIPCHRVVGANGSLAGYAYGVKMKENILYMEKQNS